MSAVCQALGARLPRRHWIWAGSSGWGLRLERQREREDCAMRVPKRALGGGAAGGWLASPRSCRTGGDGANGMVADEGMRAGDRPKNSVEAHGCSWNMLMLSNACRGTTANTPAGHRH